MNTLQDRVTALERQNELLAQELKQIKEFLQVKEFVKPSEAAKVLGVSTHTLYTRIKHAKAFPKKSIYKEGIHWIQKSFCSPIGEEPTIRYFINPVEWQKAEES